jgi:hypothetical protein
MADGRFVVAGHLRESLAHHAEIPWFSVQEVNHLFMASGPEMVMKHRSKCEVKRTMVAPKHTTRFFVHHHELRIRIESQGKHHWRCRIDRSIVVRWIYHPLIVRC